VTDEWIKVPGGRDGDVSVRIVRPAGATGTLPVILYIHRAGWVFGNAGTHDRLVRELAVRAGAAAEFPEYSLSPEVKYPVALEECYAVARWLAEGAPGNRLDASRVAIAGDSVGGNMTAALAILAKQRGDITFAAQLPLYPLSTVSTLGAEEDELRGLPKALVINGECDVLRDEGENYARKLRAAGVDVTAARYAGTIHDFMMLNALADTNAAKAATAQAGAFLHDTLH
jgi:acetyl esterase